MTRHHRAATACRVLCAFVLAFSLWPAGVALSCTIDNRASLFANGVQATLTTAAPGSAGLWAPFTVEKAFASGSPVLFNELRSDLLRSLSPAIVAAPYRWVFGDHASTEGHAVSHRFSRPGLYQLVVYGYDAHTGQWIPFDKALVHIVAPGQVLQANLGYYALRALDVVMSGLLWLIDAALILLVLYVLISRRRRRATRS